MPALEGDMRIEVLVLCVVCDEPLDHREDLWCPGCDEADAEDATADRGAPAGRPLAVLVPV